MLESRNTEWTQIIASISFKQCWQFKTANTE